MAKISGPISWSFPLYVDEKGNRQNENAHLTNNGHSRRRVHAIYETNI